MAVFTQVSVEDLTPILQRFSLGTCVRLEGISSGIENTNYFLDTQFEGQVQHWVLTIFENMRTEDLPFFVDLTRHIYSHGLNVPAPCLDKDGEALFRIQDKDAMIVRRLEGAAKETVTSDDCYLAGSWLACMHQAVRDLPASRASVRSLAWMCEQMSALSQSNMPAEELVLLEAAIQRYESYQSILQRCPEGTVHGDLFRDNVLFANNDIAGVIDFYHACTEGLLFDLAVCANDWVTASDGTYKEMALNAMIDGYQSIRTWTTEEQQAWPFFLELAALRFWISRLRSKYTEGYQQESVAGETIKDPAEKRRILERLVRQNALFE